MSSPAVTYSSRPDYSPKAERNALAACYRFILDRANERDRLFDKSGPEDVKGRSESDFHANASIP